MTIPWGGGFSFVESFHFAFSRFDHDDCSKIALLRAFTAKQGFTPLLMLAWLALVSVDSLETQISCEHLKLLKHQDFLQFDESFPKRELISRDCNVFIRKKPAKI